MNITNRLFAYPVLSDEKDDYKDSYFNVNYEHTMQGVNSLKLSFDISMNCCDLEQLIMDGKADYVVGARPIDDTEQSFILYQSILNILFQLEELTEHLMQ